MKLHSHLGQDEVISVAWRVPQVKKKHAQALQTCTQVMLPLPAATLRQKIEQFE